MLPMPSDHYVFGNYKSVNFYKENTHNTLWGKTSEEQ